MNDELPPGWMETELRFCVDVLDSQRVPVNSDERAKRTGDVPYYGATGQVGWIDDALFNEELLLIGEDGAPFFDKSKPISYVIKGRSWVNNHAHVLRANSDLSSNQYLKYFLDWFDFHDYVNGTTRLKLTQGAMNRIVVRLAPLPEQRRIVAKLEKLLGRVNACQERLAKIPVLLKRFRQAVLAAACSGRLTADWREENPDSDVSKSLRTRVADSCPETELPLTWVACRIGDLMSLKNRFAFKSLDYCEVGVPLLRISNIQDGKIVLDGSAKLPPEKANQNFTVQKGDLLVAMSGATTGKFGVYTGDQLCLQNQRVGNIKILDLNEVLPGYRNICLQSLKGRIEEQAYGGAQPNISPVKIEALPFSCPPLLEQQQIVRRVDALFSVADQIQARFERAQQHVETFLEEYFQARGLSPDDDTVSDLLSLAEKAASRSTAFRALNTLVETGVISELQALDRMDDWKSKRR